MTYRSLPYLTIGVLLLSTLLSPKASSAAPPTGSMLDLPAYRKALIASNDPAAKTVLKEIADGPAELAAALAAAQKIGIPTTITVPAACRRTLC